MSDVFNCCTSCAFYKHFSICKQVYLDKIAAHQYITIVLIVVTFVLVFYPSTFNDNTCSVNPIPDKEIVIVVLILSEFGKITSSERRFCTYSHHKCPRCVRIFVTFEKEWLRHRYYNGFNFSYCVLYGNALQKFKAAHLY